MVKQKLINMPKKEKQVLLQPSPHYGMPANGIPMLKISGKWLKEYGFNAGDLVNITVREELLIIQPVKKPNEAE